MDLAQKWGDYTRVFSLMKGLAKLGNQIHVLIVRPENKSPRVASFVEGGIEVTEIRPPGLGFEGKRGISRHLKYLLCYPAIAKEASRIVQQGGIDCVYSYMPGTGSSVPAIRMKNKYKAKFVLDLADMYSMIRPRSVVTKSFKEADRIIVITDYLKEILMRQGVNEGKIFHVPNGVDLDLFDPKKYADKEIQEIRSGLGGEKLVVFAGALQDLNLIIHSAKFVVEQYPTVKYVIIGDHRDPKKSKSAWEDKARQEGLCDNFVFLGRKPREEIPKYLLAADVCVDSFPNKPYFAAAHPIKLLEYGACAKPIVATNVSETSRLLQNEDFGYLSEPDNASAYADCVIKALDSDKSKEMATSFSKHVQENFAWDKLAYKLQKIIES